MASAAERAANNGWRGRTAALDRRLLIAAIAAIAAAVVLALFARIMAFPLRHDEQFYIPAGALYSVSGLYSDFGFNHLPNLPILLATLFGMTGTDHFLLAGRMMIFGFWLLGIGAIAVIGRRAGAGPLAIGVAMAIFVTHPVLIGPAGMMVTNNFIPIALALLGLHLFVAGAQDDRPAMVFLSGVAIAGAIGFKLNYAFLAPVFGVAAFIFPMRDRAAPRLRRIVLPMLAGALIGGLPTLAYFAADPDGFLAHVVRYHREAQIGYWSGEAGLAEQKVMSLPQKVRLAHGLWFLDAGMFLPLTIAVLAIISAFDHGRADTSPGNRAALLLVCTLMAFGALVAFVPTPAFPQYFAPPIGFAVAAIVLLHGRLSAGGRAIAVPFLAGVALMLAVAAGPQLFSSAGALASPSRWTGIRVHREGRAISRLIGARRGPVATLSPVHAIEGGRPVYMGLASGPFMFRVGDALARSGDARHYRQLITPRTIDAVLVRDPPAAILVGQEGALDAPLAAFASARRYREALTFDAERGRLMLFVRPIP